MSIQSPQSRRRFSASSSNLLNVNGFIGCPTLMFSIEFAASFSMKSKAIFQQRCLPECFNYNSGLSRLVMERSPVFSEIDFFAISHASSKK
ncbi:hypothetical protein J6590_068366 [Homalodisca vitripennis]|nr:hypothetical protein J6590_068366 [Homalodisca vitripennis]